MVSIIITTYINEITYNGLSVKFYSDLMPFDLKDERKVRFNDFYTPPTIENAF